MYDAQKAYDEGYQECDRLLSELRILLSAHKVKAGENPKWGHVGDLGGFSRYLKDAVIMMEGE